MGDRDSGTVEKARRGARAVVRKAIDLDRYLPYRLHQLWLLISSPKVAGTTHSDDVTTRGWRILMVLARMGPMAMGEVARAISADLASTTRTTQDLLKRGFVRQRASRADRRRKLIALTADGAAFHDRMAPLRLEDERRVMAVLSAEERETLFRLIDKLHEHAEALYAPSLGSPLDEDR